MSNDGDKDTVLGERYRDRTTGFEGVATARCEYLYGPPRVEIEAVVDGRPASMWLDEPRTEPA